MNSIRDPESLLPFLPDDVRPMARAAWEAYRADRKDREVFSRLAEAAFDAYNLPESVVPRCDPDSVTAEAGPWALALARR